MEYYSPDKELKTHLGISIKDPDYITALTNYCKSPAAPFHYETNFYPHNLLIEWYKYVKESEVGYEEQDDFDRDVLREILLFIEKNSEFDQFIEHRIFLDSLHAIDDEYKKYSFIPEELSKIDEWWNCCIRKKGTKGYIETIEEDIFQKFGKRISLKENIQLV